MFLLAFTCPELIRQVMKNILIRVIQSFFI
jgi:hypothetical protein